MGAMTVAGLWGTRDWRLDLLTHFRMQYYVCFLLATIFLLYTRRWASLSIALVFLVWNGWMIFNLPANTKPIPGKPVYKAIAFNVLAHNNQVAEFRKWVLEEDPDILACVEATYTQNPLWEELDLRYPYSELRQRGGGIGIVFFSKYPIRELRPQHWPGTGNMPIEVTMPEGPVTFVVMHPQAPGGKREWEWRNRSLKDLAAYCSRQDTPVICLGDMNCSPWSPIYRQFIEESGLRPPDTRVLPRRTWPSTMPLVWTAIDQFFVSKTIKPLSEWTGPASGSDHYAIGMTFQVEE